MRKINIGLLPLATAALLALTAPIAGAASPTQVGPDAKYAFPSSGSTVVGSVGFIDGEQVGYFWSASRGDSVAETFSGPASITKARLKLDVVQNVLSAGNTVDWTLSINGTDVCSFVVSSGQTGKLTKKCSFAKITGGSYAVKIRVTNEVPAGGGSITLRYAGAGPHQLKLK